MSAVASYMKRTLKAVTTMSTSTHSSRLLTRRSPKDSYELCGNSSHWRQKERGRRALEPLHLMVDVTPTRPSSSLSLTVSRW